MSGCALFLIVIQAIEKYLDQALTYSVRTGSPRYFNQLWSGTDIACKYRYHLEFYLTRVRTRYHWRMDLGGYEFVHLYLRSGTCVFIVRGTHSR